jgi:hypothetical protein
VAQSGERLIPGRQKSELSWETGVIIAAGSALCRAGWRRNSQAVKLVELGFSRSSREAIPCAGIVACGNPNNSLAHSYHVAPSNKKEGAGKLLDASSSRFSVDGCFSRQ